MAELPSVHKKLIPWFQKHKRSLPWRKTKDPYRIWLSEIMLQQTQVKTVIPYYQRWLKHFPNLTSLAQAQLPKVLKLWEGLGYYRRARHMHEAAKIILEQYGGKFPADPESLHKLPGIGRYTQGAILSIAFDIPVPLVDGNVARVLSRLFAIPEPIDSREGEKRLWELAKKLVPKKNPGDFNQALMELGATVCLPNDPWCDRCPVSNFCSAFRQGDQEDYPKKIKKNESKKVRAVCGLVHSDGKLLITQRPSQGLWAGLWEFPTFRLTEKADSESTLDKKLHAWGLRVCDLQKKGSLKRSYTIHREDLEIYFCKLVSDKKKGRAVKLPARQLLYVAPTQPWDLGGPVPVSHRWVRRNELGRFAFPSAYAKIIREYL